MGRASQGSDGSFRLCGGEIIAPCGGGPVSLPARHVQISVGCAVAMRGGARPLPVHRGGDHASPHRVQFDVTKGLPKMRFIEGTGVEPPLPDVAGRGEASVPVGGVASVSVAEGVGQSGGGARYRD